MWRAIQSAMTPASPSSAAAVAAFLRGLEKRAQLFAAVQAGDASRGSRALAAVARVFASEAAQWPLAQWPQQYWRLLLATPSLRQAGVAEPSGPLPGIARLAPEPRAAVLLHVVAALQDDAAAFALGLEVPAYQALIRDSLPRDQLGQPDVDVWRAWRAAAQRELDRAPEPAPLAKASAAAPPAEPRAIRVQPAPIEPQGSRWLWIGVGACVLAFAAAFFIHPAGRQVLDQWFATIKREPLPSASEPRSRFDPANAALHPDREQLDAPREAAFAERLPLLAWLVDASADLRAPDAVSLPIADTSSTGATAVTDSAGALAQRTRRWNALSASERGRRRGQWQAWRALDAGERVQLREIAGRFDQLAPGDADALRIRFDAQSSDARAGWWLGPRMGRDWPRVAALFGYVEPGERERLLSLLRSASPAEIDALARLAQSTPPEARADLRGELLAQPAHQRGAWLEARLQR